MKLTVNSYYRDCAVIVKYFVLFSPHVFGFVGWQDEHPTFKKSFSNSSQKIYRFFLCFSVHIYSWLEFCQYQYLPSDRRHLSCDDFMEQKKEDYQNCSVLYCVSQLYTVISTHRWAVLTGILATRYCCDLGLVKVFVAIVCFDYLWVVCILYVFSVFSAVCFVLSVPVQVIAWKDSSPKWPVMWPVMCWAGRKTLLTHSVVYCYRPA